MPRNFPNWLSAYTDYTSDLEAPDRVHFWVGVSTLAGAIRRRVWLEPSDKFEWTPNFYTILVGPAGIIGKTTCMNAGIGLLEQIKPPIHFGPESLTWQALGKDLEAAVDVLSLGEGDDKEKIPMSCLTIAAGELGTLLKLEDDGLASMLIAMWDGQRSLRPWRHSTVASSKIEIQNPWLNIIGCTTPTWLKKNFPTHMIGGGLTSRILFVFADRKRKLIAYPAHEWQGGAADRAALRKALVADLEHISHLAGRFTLTPEALEWGTVWYAKLWSERPARLASASFDAYIARKQTFLHKIAMVLSAARTDDLVITPQLLIEADALLTTNETDMLRVFESIGIVAEARHIHEIAQFLRVHGMLPVNKLWELCYAVMEMKDFQTALAAAIEAGVMEKVVLPPGSSAKFGLRLPPRHAGMATAQGEAP